MGAVATRLARALVSLGLLQLAVAGATRNATSPPNPQGSAQTAKMWAAVRGNLADSTGSAVVAASTRQFNASTQRVVNPERGFRHELDDLCGTNFTRGQLTRLHECREYNMTIAQTYCYLDGETDTIGDEMLARLESGFAKLRAAGVKALLRFAYDRCPNQSGEYNYTTSRILKHIGQLAPVVGRNVDAVYALQAGFIGCWGEWHDSRMQIEYNSSAIAEILAAELGEMLPVDRKMTLRYPWDKCCGRDGGGGALRSPASAELGLEWGVVDASTAQSGKAFARLGYDDDGFMCCGKNQTDGGTRQTSLYRSRLGPASARDNRPTPNSAPKTAISSVLASSMNKQSRRSCHWTQKCIGTRAQQATTGIARARMDTSLPTVCSCSI